jgi:polyisoprenoid-binding protein YceI
MEMTGSAKDPQGNMRTGFLTDFTINRSEFGMKFMAPNMVGDVVRMTVALETVK